jgi:hypothetical protein
MISWEDGLEYGPDGLQFRQIVQPDVWTSSVWISEEGEAYRRHYNTESKEWNWEEMPYTLDKETQTRIGVHLQTGWMSVETAIATAWRYRCPNSRSYVRISDPGNPNAQTLAWGEEELYPEEGTFTGEKWTPLRWHCGIVACNKSYQISTCGRLKSPHTGVMTRGFAAHGSRWAACKGSGLVNLLQAANLVAAEKRVPPRVYMAYRSLCSGLQAREHARRTVLTEKVAWDYYNLAAPLVHNLRVVGKKMVNPSLWNTLEGMKGDPLLGGKLSDLHPEVELLLGREISMEELRFARTCVSV